MKEASMLPTRLIRFVTESSGASQLEYAILLLVVVTGTVPAAMYIESSIRGTMNQTARIVDLDGARQAAPSHDHPKTIATAARPNQAGMIVSVVAAILLLSVGGLVCWNMSKRSPSVDAVTADDLPDDAIAIAKRNAVFEKRHAIYQVLVGDMTSLFNNRVEVAHLMSRKIVSVPPDRSAESVAQLMRQKHLRHVLVCQHDQLVGIISDRDVNRVDISRRPSHDRNQLTASDIMTSDPLSVEPQSLASPAVTMLVQNKISCLPVVEQGRVQGILTTTDLLFAFQGILRSLQKSAADTKQSINSESTEGAIT